MLSCCYNPVLVVCVTLYDQGARLFLLQVPVSRLPWDQSWVRHADNGHRELVYINGPFEQMGAILSRVRDDKMDCILIGPQWPRYWQALLLQVTVKAVVTLPHVDDLFQPGMHVPAQKRHAKHPKYSVMAWFILWN